MSRLLLAAGLLLLLLFAYLTAIRSAFVLVYGLTLVLVLAFWWPRQVIRRIKVTRHIEAGTPTVGEAFEESFTAEKTGWVPAPWVEIRDMSEIKDYQPGRGVSLGRLPARDQRRPRLLPRGLAGTHPLEALDQVRPDDVEDLRAATDLGPADRPRPAAIDPSRPGRGVDPGVRDQPRGLHQRPGPQPGPPGRPDHQ